MAKKAAAKTKKATPLIEDDGKKAPKKADPGLPGDTGTGPEPHEINSALASPRMKALLKDHREMGSRP